MPIITIRGQLGSLVPEIGQTIAQKLNIDYVDREIIASVAERLRQPRYAIENKEMPPTPLRGRIAEAMSHASVIESAYAGIYLPAWEVPLNDSEFLAGLKHVIEEMARGGAIVIRGRGSRFILRNNPDAFHMLIVAPLEIRVKRVMAKLRLNELDAREEIIRSDDGRREFIKRYFREEMMNPLHYDLILNTRRLSVEDAAAIAVDAIERMEEAGGNCRRSDPPEDRPSRKVVPARGRFPE
jgi:cytidylate kinase